MEPFSGSGVWVSGFWFRDSGLGLGAFELLDLKLSVKLVAAKQVGRFGIFFGVSGV